MYRVTFSVWVVVLSLIGAQRGEGLRCSRYPANTFTAKSPVDENFAISIVGNPQTYILGQSYNVSLNAYNGLRFVSFILALENDNGVSSYNDDLGHFEVSDPIESRYNPRCVNVVENTNTNPKTDIDLVWVAPTQPGSGCVLIRATLMQHRDVWYMDDGGLTKRICEEVVDDVESQKPSRDSNECCACDEARYEITFEGVWSRNLHPNFFPAKGWLTRFSDIIGAAHTNDYRFWQYGELASESMKQFGEHGTATLLEREFNHYFKLGKIRTILKARGPSFPNLNSKTVASVRMDPQHHSLSLASKIIPSPDWIVGVSGLKLCMRNCTWLQHKVITLYPWDLGTDAGPSYTSADQPQVPADVIRRIRSDFPNDPRSPFFDETGTPMKPMATLTVRLLRTYERMCNDENSNNTDDPRECVTHPWSAWTECSAKCGPGRQFRQRVYKQPVVAKIYNCDLLMVNQQERECVGTNCGSVAPRWNPNSGVYPVTDDDSERNGETKAECELTDWTEWTECSKACGEGKMMRTRQFVNPSAEQDCQNSQYQKLYQYKKCIGRSCLGEVPERQRENEDEAPAYPHSPGSRIKVYPYDREESSSFNSPISRMHNQNPYEREQLSSTEDLRPGQAEDRRFPPGEEQPFAEPNNEDVYPENEDVSYSSSYRPNFEVGNLNKFPESRTPLPPRLEDSESSRLTYSPRMNRPRQETPDFLPANDPSRTRGRYQGQERIPHNCLKPIRVSPSWNTTIVGNFWFFNFCEEKCMLYAADNYDRNENKFTSFEACQAHCNRPEFEHQLRQVRQRECRLPTNLY